MVFAQALAPSSDADMVLTRDDMTIRKGSTRQGGVSISLEGKEEGYIPNILGMPFVYSEVSLKIPVPLPPVWDSAGNGNVAKLQKCLQESVSFHYEATVAKDGGSGRAVLTPEIEATSSGAFKEWSSSLTELQDSVQQGTAPYGIIMNRQGLNSVWFLTKNTCTVVGATRIIERVKELCDAARVVPSSLSNHSLQLHGYVGMGIGVNSILDTLPIQIGLKLPLLLAPVHFLNSTSRLPTIRTFTDSSSRFEPPTHYVKLSGRILPHSLASIFTTARLLGSFESDLSPNQGTSIFSYAVPFQTPWNPNTDLPTASTQQCPRRLVVHENCLNVAGFNVSRPE
eukprot:TRINITY_DN13027_c0_g1_i1.p1 TRINITY_DN13027_c0_g1~~TRINITY_DN13027_c0_g1_i1.p1  ORF type:complete len:340 (+),score=20.49 TRINITY_DN13027_c0_g1_i1:55-1074(+)